MELGLKLSFLENVSFCAGPGRFTHVERPITGQGNKQRVCWMQYSRISHWLTMWDAGVLQATDERMSLVSNLLRLSAHGITLSTYVQMWSFCYFFSPRNCSSAARSLRPTGLPSISSIISRNRNAVSDASPVHNAHRSRVNYALRVKRPAGWHWPVPKGEQQHSTCRSLEEFCPSCSGPDQGIWSPRLLKAERC